MKPIFLLSFVFYTTCTKAQSFISYKDSINRFSINIPQGWKYGLNKNYPTIKLFAFRSPESLSDTSKDNFNINIFESPNSNLEKSYTNFLRSLSSDPKTKIIEHGEIIINDRKFKWLIEIHENENNRNIQMANYDFITYQDDKTYILTTVTFANKFDTRKELFKTIANSFHVH